MLQLGVVAHTFCPALRIITSVRPAWCRSCTGQEVQNCHRKMSRKVSLLSLPSPDTARLVDCCRRELCLSFLSIDVQTL